MRELVQYGIVMLMIEDHKVKIIERRTTQGREWLTSRTYTPEIFSIVLPEMSDDVLGQTVKMAREIVSEESRDAPRYEE